MTHKEWEIVIFNLSKADKVKYALALEVLEEWKELKNAFDWTQLFHLKTMLKIY